MAGVPTIALIPPKPILTRRKRAEGLCDSCDKPIDLRTGECSGCTGQ